MRIEVNNTIELSKSFGVRRRKVDGLQSTWVTVKFESLFIHRDYSDEMLGLPIAATSLLYGEDGIPVSMITIGRKHITYMFAGAITGNQNRNERISLTGNVQIEKAELQLVDKGALLSGRLTWPARGDEVEDLDPLLGQTCMLTGVISLPEQVDAFDKSNQGVA